MAKNTVEYKLKIKNVTSGDPTGQLTKAFKDLGLSIDLVEEKTNGLKMDFLNLNQLKQVFDNVRAALNQMVGVFDSLTGAYAAQVEAANRLQTVMRNTMGATDAEIQSIKDLCSAQQELGVIGDEVQLAGAQELATYMSKKESLEKLIPVMNDIVAQQYGYNATAEGAVGIATMMGKVFAGQVSALSRYGYIFDEVQEKILKYGTEEEKAATLAEVVRQSVGGVNQELAKTDYGKFVQLNNRLGDIRENLGKMIQPFAGFVKKVGEVGFAANGILQFGTTMTNAGKALITATNAQKLFNAAVLKNPYVRAATVLAGLVTAMVAFSRAANTASRYQKTLNDAVKDAQTQIATERTQLDRCFDALKNAQKGTADYSWAISAINEKYGEYLPNMLTEKSTAEDIAKAYDDCTRAISQKIITQMRSNALDKIGADAAQKQLDYAETIRKTVEGKYNIDKAGSAEMIKRIKETTEGYRKQGLSIEEAKKRAISLAKAITGDDDLDKSTTVTSSGNWGTVSTTVENSTSKAIIDLTESIYDLGDAYDAADDKFKPFMEDLKKMQSVGGVSVGNSGNKGDESKKQEKTYDPGTLGAYEQQLQKLREAQKNASKENAISIQKEIDVLSNKKKMLEAIIGLEAKGVSESSMAAPTAASPGTGGLAIKAKPIDLDNVGKELHEKAEKIQSDMTKTFSDTRPFEAMQAGLGALSNTMQSFGSIVGEAAGKWLDWGANLVQAISTAIPQIALLRMTEEQKAAVSAKSAAFGAMASLSSIPVVGPALGIAAMASVVAAMLSLPKFAQGGLAYGPTLGLFGEYAGAANNPEVVAPLDELQSMLDTGDNVGQVTFRISGRDLEGVLNKRGRINQRTR